MLSSLICRISVDEFKKSRSWTDPNLLVKPATKPCLHNLVTTLNVLVSSLIWPPTYHLDLPGNNEVDPDNSLKALSYVSVVLSAVLSLMLETSVISVVLAKPIELNPVNASLMKHLENHLD